MIICVSCELRERGLDEANGKESKKKYYNFKINKGSEEITKTKLKDQNYKIRVQVILQW